MTYRHLPSVLYFKSSASGQAKIVNKLYAIGKIKMERLKGFNLVLFGDLELEGMAIEIHYDYSLIATITYEKGIDQMEIELYNFKDNLQREIYSLDEFLSILKKGKQLAIKCAKEDELQKKQGNFY